MVERVRNSQPPTLKVERSRATRARERQRVHNLVRSRAIGRIASMRPNQTLNLLTTLATAGLLVALKLHAQAEPEPRPHTAWVAPGSRETLRREMVFENPIGRLGVLNVSGPIDTAGHPFFTAIG